MAARQPLEIELPNVTRSSKFTSSGNPVLFQPTQLPLKFMVYPGDAPGSIKLRVGTTTQAWPTAGWLGFDNSDRVIELEDKSSITAESFYIKKGVLFGAQQWPWNGTWHAKSIWRNLSSTKDDHMKMWLFITPVGETNYPPSVVPSVKVLQWASKHTLNGSSLTNSGALLSLGPQDFPVVQPAVAGRERVYAMLLLVLLVGIGGVYWMNRTRM